MRTFILVLLVLSGCKDKACDMRSESGARAAYKRITGKTSRDDCATVISAFPGLADVGEGYADDAGCLGEIRIWKCHRQTDADLPEILQSRGWKTTDDKGREEIALDWIELDTDVTEKKVTAKDGGLHIEGRYQTTHVNVAGEYFTTGAFVADFTAEGAAKFERTPEDGSGAKMKLDPKCLENPLSAECK